MSKKIYHFIKMQLNMILQQANNIIFYHCIYQTNKYKNIPGWSIFFILIHSFLFFFFFALYFVL
jgi:hypothetical protein